jgi:hypothetical protein
VVVDMPPVSDEEARMLLRALAPGLGEDDAARVCAAAAGNPSFLEMLAHAAKAGTSSELPLTLQAAIAARVDDLDPDPRALVRHASIFAAPFAEEVLARVAGRTDIAGDLARLCDAGFLTPDAAGSGRR